MVCLLFVCTSFKIANTVSCLLKKYLGEYMHYYCIYCICTCSEWYHIVGKERM